MIVQNPDSQTAQLRQQLDALAIVQAGSVTVQALGAGEYANVTVTLPKAYSTAEYSVQLTLNQWSNEWTNAAQRLVNKQPDSFTIEVVNLSDTMQLGTTTWDWTTVPYNNERMKT